MPWQARSRRRAELPADWPHIRAAILDRDAHWCRYPEPHRCDGAATQVDHIGDRHDHSAENLRAICATGHRQRTAAQGHAARPKRNREPEQHPALQPPWGAAPTTPESRDRHV